jgi:mRNA interferase RelE/StbE
MVSYKIIWKKSAVKELKSIPKKNISQILSEVEILENNPYPHGVKKISGSDHTYRIRIGDYRVIYSILNKILTIEIIRVGHRKEVYKFF